MEIKTHTEIINEIKNTDELQAIEIIINGQPTSTEVECSVILSDNLFSWGYETIYNNELVDKLQCCVRGKDIILIQFIDTELPKAWEQSYLLGGIPKERHDRRVKFHPYNEMNELFCVDANLLWDITDRFKGTDHELTQERCSWRWNMIKWYKNHLI